MAQLFVNVTAPAGSPAIVNRTFQVSGNVSWVVPTSPTHTLTSRSATVIFGIGGQVLAAEFIGNTWRCTGTVSDAVPWDSLVTVTVNARATFRFFHNPSEPDILTLNAST